MKAPLYRARPPTKTLTKSNNTPALSRSLSYSLTHPIYLPRRQNLIFYFTDYTHRYQEGSIHSRRKRRGGITLTHSLIHSLTRTYTRTHTHNKGRSACPSRDNDWSPRRSFPRKVTNETNERLGLSEVKGNERNGAASIN